MGSRLSLFEFSGVDGTGIELARKLLQMNISTPILMLTIENRADTIVKALEAGASGYLLKGDSASQIRKQYNLYEREAAPSAGKLL